MSSIDTDASDVTLFIHFYQTVLHLRLQNTVVSNQGHDLIVEGTSNVHVSCMCLSRTEVTGTVKVASLATKVRQI
jgi:hypothetical protein